GKKLSVEVSYKLIGKNRYSFEVAKADPSLPIVIDPILQATYLGGTHSDEARALAIHPTTGDVYVAGLTNSTNFPKITGGAQASKSRSNDAFVSRLNKDLTQILQSTYLGGSGANGATTLAIHPKTGEVYVAGYTYSTDFPNTAGGAQAASGGQFDAFVARLNPNLTQILQSTYLGGSNWDEAYALAVHSTKGEVYVAGRTESRDFPRTTGGAQASFGGRDSDAFVARLNKDLTQILQSTYLGGSGADGATTLAIHPKTGEVYVAGYTNSTDFPNTTGGAQKDYEGKNDAFVARLNPDLTQNLQSTYLGGSDDDKAVALAIHPKTGEVYVAGYTLSADFPNTTGGAQKDYGGYGDAFVARLSADLAEGRRSADGGGYRMIGSVSSLTDAWNILLLLSIPAFVLARRIGG
ncbi:MAG: SBBP repeat-containing protein, partial [Thermocrinis sp.]|uniref:SBBP repeat-containing protein n=1 Tax=Thermocrinis sp. TaxID=2024383 RepID=UPI003C0604DD